MSRAVIYEQFGGPEVLEVRDVPEPHPGQGEIRVRVTAAGLNPMDWGICARPEAAARFGVTLPAGFGCDLAGVAGEVGAGAEGYAAGDRVYGAAMAKAVADFAIVPAAPSALYRLMPTPDGISDEAAAALPTPGLTAAAALGAIGPRSGDTALIGGAAGGVGVLAVQLARLAGARVIGTASPGTFGFLRELGAEPVAYGPGLADRVRAIAPEGITAATDLFGTETAEAALALGVSPDRISTIAAGPNPPNGVRPAGGSEAAPADLERITQAMIAGEITVPIAATFPVERIRGAVALQAGRHVHGKVVVTPQAPGRAAKAAVEPAEGGGEAEGGVVAAGGLVSAHRDAAPLPEPADAAFGDVAAAAVVPPDRSEVDRPSGVPAAAGDLVVAPGIVAAIPCPRSQARFAFDG